ncbi:hypothetical protein [Lysobacter enzymogenes]|uniref:hypothetical protein n=1 Tax=Lysobacter enzymogenes TaxID=69 RepID=UPI001A95E9FB|nr:hypothetical protein [Lysobacter enzymogenes]QQP95726.1 hypothetical protein JHW38_21270 [Lysobacter enzymogenes]
MIAAPPHCRTAPALAAMLWLAAALSPATAGAAEPAHYLQLDPHWVGEPYQWQLEDGTVLQRGVADEHARAAVAARPGQERYALETLALRYPVRIAAACWKLSQKRFDACIERGEAGPSRARRQADAESDRALEQNLSRRRERAAWTGLDGAAVAARLRGALDAQAAWDATAQARQAPARLDCGQAGAGVPPLADAGERRFRAALAAGARTPAGETELIAAARLGHWRAAATLAKLALYDDDWESAQAIAAWLLERGAPAGYNALARSLEAAGSSEDGRATPGQRDLVARLRRRAAFGGDPGAQMDLADELEASDPAGTQRLRDCARQRFPDIDG